MNVNEPETRGVALALHVVLDDLGKARRRLQGFAPTEPARFHDSTALIHGSRARSSDVSSGMPQACSV